MRALQPLQEIVREWDSHIAITSKPNAQWTASEAGELTAAKTAIASTEIVLL
jgi:hypothetical protein